MTADELRSLLSIKYGFNPWPEYLYVDAETYGNVTNYLIKGMLEGFNEVTGVLISIGPRGGILFKDVELLLQENNGTK